MRSRLAEWLELLTANAKVATFMSSITASSDTQESEGRQMKQCRIKCIKNLIILKKDKYFGNFLIHMKTIIYRLRWMK
jgi:hypothetical protein